MYFKIVKYIFKNSEIETKYQTTFLYITFSLFLLIIGLFYSSQVFREEIIVTTDNFSDHLQLNGDATYGQHSRVVTLIKDENNKSSSVVIKSIKMDLSYAFSFDTDIDIENNLQVLGDSEGRVIYPGYLGDIGGNGGYLGIEDIKMEIRKNKKFSLIFGLIMFFSLLFSLGITSNAEANNDINKEQMMISIANQDGETVMLTQKEFEVLKVRAITPESTVGDIKKEVTNYRTLQEQIKPDTFSARAVTNPIFGDWSNWQKSGVGGVSLLSGGITSIGDNRFMFNITVRLYITNVGDTHGFALSSYMGLYTKSAYNITTTTNTASGDTSKVYYDLTRSQQVGSLNGVFPSSYKSDPDYQLIQRYNSDSKMIYYYPNTTGSVDIKGRIDYNSSQKNGHDDSSNDITRIWGSAFYEPKVAKSVHKDLDTGADLGQAEVAGKGGYYGNSLSLESKNFANYTFDHQQVLDENGYSKDFASNSWKGSMDLTKRGIVFWYVKNATNLSLSKSNNKGSGAKVGDIVSYTLSAKNGGTTKLYTPRIEDTLPVGMDKPTNIKVNSSADLGEGESNKNAYGEYYTWDSSTRKLTIYYSQTDGVGAGSTSNISYDSKLISGNDGDTKTNEATLYAKNNAGNNPSANSSFKVNGVPKLVITKAANLTKAKIGDTINYTIVGKNEGNGPLYNTLFEDILPEGMDEPTNVKVANGSGNSYAISKGSANKNEWNEYYTWDNTNKKLTVYVSRANATDSMAVNSSRTMTYSSKVLTGKDGEKKTNTVTLSGSNTDQKPSASIVVNIRNLILHVKQEVINKNNQIVIPTIGAIKLNNIMLNNINSINESYNMNINSYEVDTNKPFKTVILVWSDTYEGYLPKEIIPEFYEYSGYVLTSEDKNHSSSNRINQQLPVIDYSQKAEYWLTVYIEPKVGEDGPPFYNWDYKINEFGKIK